jgi:hypothetical protein
MTRSLKAAVAIVACYPTISALADNSVPLKKPDKNQSPSPSPPPLPGRIRSPHPLPPNQPQHALWAPHPHAPWEPCKLLDRDAVAWDASLKDEAVELPSGGKKGPTPWVG